MTRVFFAFTILLAVLADECTFDLGELNKYFISYDLKVTNSSPTALAAVTVKMPGAARSSTLGKGRTLDVLTFGGGAYTISVSNIGLRRQQLQRQLDLLRMHVDGLNAFGGAQNQADIDELKVQIKETMAALATVAAGGGTTCSGTLKANQSKTVVLTENGGQWSC